MDVHNLNSEHPIFDNPQKLFFLQNTGEPPKWPIIHPTWSMDGKRVAISATGINGKGDVFLGDSNEKKWINLTKSPEEEGAIHWSQNGEAIFYTGKLEPGGRMYLFSITLDGQSKKQLMSKLDPSIDLSWFSISSDGKRVVFSSTVNLFDQLFIADLDGSNLLQLTNREENHYLPHFTPDGQWIIYWREPWTMEPISDISLIKPDGSEEKKLQTDSLANKTSFAWSPVGNWIAITVENSEDFHTLYIIRPDGTGLTQVTPSTSDVHFPAWRVILP